MKETIISIRVSEELKNELETISISKSTSVSKLVRDSLLFYTSNAEPEHTNPKCNKDEIDILKSLGFTEFIYWICDKQRDPEINEIDELYTQFINLIDEMAQYPLFQGEIMIEFQKIKLELNEYLKKDTHFKVQFSFPEPNGFNYEILNSFMHTIRYDRSNNRILHLK